MSAADTEIRRHRRCTNARANSLTATDHVTWTTSAFAVSQLRMPRWLYAGQGVYTSGFLGAGLAI
jgi:hypothetical protein